MKKIEIEDLKNIREGLVIPGCGGDLNEWIDGIHQMLRQEGILKNDSSFDEVYAFDYNDITHLVFEMKDVELDIGKLAIWRLNTHHIFGGTWLSDFKFNRIGWDYETAKPEKPDCELIGQNGNIFNLLGIAARTLWENDMPEQAKEMTKRITREAKDYYEALNIIGEYVNITGPEEEPQMEM